MHPPSKETNPPRQDPAATPGPAFVWHEGRATLTLKQLDEWNDQPKGTLFRWFKAVLPQLQEGRDFFRIDGRASPSAVQRLRQDGRLHASSLHAILLTASGYQCLLECSQGAGFRPPGLAKGLRPSPFASEP